MDNLNVVTKGPKFLLGLIQCEPKIFDLLDEIDFKELLKRHRCGDWGDVAPETLASNEVSIREGGCITSMHYLNRDGENELWITTSEDRLRTTLSLATDGLPF